MLIFSFPEFEAGFIRLLDKLTNGTRIEVNETGEYWLILLCYNFNKKYAYTCTAGFVIS